MVFNIDAILTAVDLPSSIDVFIVTQFGSLSKKGALAKDGLERRKLYWKRYAHWSHSCHWDRPTLSLFWKISGFDSDERLRQARPSVKVKYSRCRKGHITHEIYFIQPNTRGIPSTFLASISTLAKFSALMLNCFEACRVVVRRGRKDSAFIGKSVNCVSVRGC